jgi:hypothetical protein
MNWTVGIGAGAITDGWAAQEFRGKGTRAASAQPSFNYGLDGERRGGYVASKNAGAVAPS